MATWTSIITTCCVSSIIFYACQSSYDSIRSSLKLPGLSRGSAAGYDDENDIILIFGDYDWPQQFMQFKNNEFIYYNRSYIPSHQTIGGGGQNYFQLNNTLWMLNAEGTHFLTARTHPPYTVTMPAITIPILVDYHGCLAMAHDHIFIVGGATTADCDPRDSVQIYDMINDEWFSRVPSLPNSRTNAACYAVGDTLYAIGGFGDYCDEAYDSILTLNISDAALKNISSQQWQVAPFRLNTPSGGSCIVKHRNDLIVIGGADVNWYRLKDVNVINTLTGECFFAGTLSIGTTYSACIIHRSTNTLYVFGGRDATDSWQFINLPTVDATVDPTTDRSHSPTQFPTSNPTGSPTHHPSLASTLQPSPDPSLPPTQFPTSNPTGSPTQHPPLASTLQPSSDPSLPPTKVNATISPLRDTTEYTAIVHDTASVSSATENSKLAKREPEFTTVELMTFIILCALSVIMVVIICGIIKKGKKESLKHEQTILDLNHSVPEMNNAKNIANRNKENRRRGDSDNVSHKGNAESSSSFTWGEQVNEDKLTTTGADVTVGAMIADKIVLGIVSTKRGLDKVVQSDGEKGEKDDIELANVGEDSASSERLYDNHDTTGGAVDPQSMQNAMRFVGEVEEGPRVTSK